MAFPTQSVQFVRASSQEASTTFNSAIATASAFTIEAWVKLDSLNTNGEICGWRGQTDGGFILTFNAATNNLLFRFWDTATTNNTDITTNSAPITSTGVWTHIAAAANGATGIICVNGTSVSVSTSGTATCVANTNGTFAIGGNNGFLPGHLGLVRYWNTNLSAATIDANKCTILGATTNLKAEWKLDGDFTDNSGNAVSLTGVNSPTFSADVTSSCPTTSGSTIFTSTLLTLGVG